VGYEAGRHRAARHAVELRRLWGLYQHDAAIRDDFFQAQRAIAPRAREDDADGEFAPILPERAE